MSSLNVFNELISQRKKDVLLNWIDVKRDPDGLVSEGCLGGNRAGDRSFFFCDNHRDNHFHKPASLFIFVMNIIGKICPNVNE